ncbi:hypothetical protein JAAARDRAFT_199829 [Jaapia argillacea MUCL 33604]|uniref:RRM domain-containing protein n=1 Tax=Jaapia argillacea MUCL 33604 TaxID=933084 RepID=A0A067P6Q3_9AGAM|nr:hypothetical protein JAAARDRAFT_199829 [Jaapia argillacea MUCL 33604]
MSRLIIKNLPSYTTPTSLRAHFSQSSAPTGIITDVKVAYKPDGTSRRFGFVGYRSEEEAAKAREWFEGTFVGGCKIIVGVVDGTKDAPAPRPNKRPRLGPSPTDPSSSSLLAPTKPGSTKGIKEPQGAKQKPDKQLDEFMKVMQPRTKGRTWANEEAAPLSTAVPSASSVKKGAKAKEEPDGVVVDGGAEGGAEVREEGMSDLDWMRKRMSKAVDSGVEEKVFEQDDEVGDVDVEMKDDDDEPPEPTIHDHQEEQDPTKRTILSTSRLFVRNLAFSCTEDELRECFGRYGDISQIHIPLSSTSTSKGLAYITFTSPTSALAAYEALDGRSFQGRLLHILGAVDRKGKPEVEEKKGNVKEEKEKKRKAGAGKEFNWAMLYMNSDAVASSIADRMNMSKSDILGESSENPSSANPAVKLALAETHIIQETKAYLESHGVVLSSFSSSTTEPRPKRSNTAILVKNIPYGMTAAQITAMFEPYGELSRVLVPPAGTLAVVEFVKSEEARKGFGGVAYRRVGSSVVYLEWAPVGMFAEGAAPLERQPVEEVAKSRGVRIEEDVRTPVGEGEGDVVSGSTLFVKNLAFSTTTDRLTSVFRHLPDFLFARVQTKPDPKHPPVSSSHPEPPRLSMGYGFVGFKSPEGAKKALKGMQGQVLDGHELVVKFAGRGTEDDGKAEGTKGAKKGARTTKMIVKNVPFEASKKDIRQLFGSQGQLKSLRLPKRFDHRSRGFAFLEFTTRQEAENAYDALKHTHLLGRHLVLQWADEEDGEEAVEKLRMKAGVGFGGGKEMPGRKRKLELGGEDKGGGEGEDA